MVLAKLKNFGSGLSEDVKQFKSLLGRVRLTADTSTLGANFRKFGPSFSVYEFDAFVEKAREFFADGMESTDPYYTVIEMPDNRIAIDYNGDIRGIFTRKGKPLAFFRPDYYQSGYRSKNDELADFKKGKNLFS